MKNRYQSLILPLVTLILVSGCSSFNEIYKQPENCGLVNDNMFTSFSGARIGPSDVSTFYSILNNYNTKQAWKSNCGANVVAEPSEFFINRQTNLNCRKLTVKVDNLTDHIVSCRTLNGKWILLSHDLINVKQPKSTNTKTK